ncbi:ABC transporter ATP-binding protein, partial [Candidatus Bathyarchaeota archaeon]
MYYQSVRGDIKAVDGIDLRVDKGRAVGLAGESGSGKTSVALTVLRLLPSNARVMDGTITFDGQNVLTMDEERFRKEIRWKKISMIFQGAMNALHPIYTIGDQICEAIRTHENVRKKVAFKRAEKLLDLVGIGAERINRYPHELSGGMKQRAIIAMALACNPDLVIADEPTTALDVIIQAQILGAIRELQQKLHLSMLLITHDLSIIAQTCDECAIMYAGKIVETGAVNTVLKKPLHPYTQKLILAFPNILNERKELALISGSTPNLLNPPSGCRFHPRCPYAMELCEKEE